MNRRDIIIIAVLLNTGLLSALVMMAIQTDPEKFVDQTELTSLVADNALSSSSQIQGRVLASQNSTVATDEWDSVLKDYVNANSTAMTMHDDEASDEFEKEFEEPKKVIKETPKTTTNQTALKSHSKTVEITVKKGDALEKIARANGTTVEEIRALNHLKNDRLSIGQTLLIPVEASKVVKTEVKIEPPPVVNAVKSEDVEYYVIKSGDNPWKIAKQFKVKFEDLLKLNNLDEEKARNLKIGDKIRVK